MTWVFAVLSALIVGGAAVACVGLARPEPSRFWLRSRKSLSLVIVFSIVSSGEDYLEWWERAARWTTAGLLAAGLTARWWRDRRSSEQGTTGPDPVPPVVS